MLEELDDKLAGAFRRQLAEAPPEEAALLRRIETDPNIRFGSPRVTSCALTVAEVLGYAAMLPPGEIYLDFPGLTEGDVKACMLYAHYLLRSRDEVTADQRTADASWRREPPAATRVVAPAAAKGAA